MVKDAWPETCLRVGQSRVTITLVEPLLCGMKFSVQVRVEPPGIRLKPGNIPVLPIKHKPQQI